MASSLPRSAAYFYERKPAVHKTVEPLGFKGLSIFWVFAGVAPELRVRLIRFWLDNGAIRDPFEAWRRTFEVTCVAVDGAEEIVAVSSVYAGRLEDGGEPYWFYRTFVRPDCRVTGLSPRVLQQTLAGLAGYVEEPGSPRGVIIIADNAKLERQGALRLIRRQGFEYLGSAPLGNSIWRHHFPA